MVLSVPPIEVRIRIHDPLKQGAGALLPLPWPSTEQLQVVEPALAIDRSLPGAKLPVCGSLLSRCECGCFSFVFSRRWPLLPRFGFGVDPAVAVAAVCNWAAAGTFDAAATVVEEEVLIVFDGAPLPFPAFSWALREFFPFELLVELLLSSAPDTSPAAPFCMSALTISCLASDVFVPGFVRLIFILSDWWSSDILVPALPAPCPPGADDIFVDEWLPDGADVAADGI